MPLKTVQISLKLSYDSFLCDNLWMFSLIVLLLFLVNSFLIAVGDSSFKGIRVNL